MSEKPITHRAGPRLSGKVAIVTGGGKGIGSATAQVLAAEGAHVMVATRTAGPGQETVDAIVSAGGSGELLVIDMADKAAVFAMVDGVAARRGRLDVVVHNAAVMGRHAVTERDDALLDAMLTVNVKACFWLAAASQPHMAKGGGGRLLITSSVTGPRVTMPGSGAYSASKGAVNGFIKAAALELAEFGITVNGVEPGYIDTPGLSRMKARYGAERIGHFIPYGALGDPADVAHAFLYLASDEAKFVTGQTIIVDGGAMLAESPVWKE
jgi:3-oxoacyl-[acyl-carrier protein] reductase